MNRKGERKKSFLVFLMAVSMLTQQTSGVALAEEDLAVQETMEDSEGKSTDLEGKNTDLKLDENGQNETGEVYLYSFSRTADGDPMLANIEDDEEYDAAANAFNAIVEKARADEEADAPLS